MGDKGIKSKPQSVRAMDNAPKTVPKIKDKVIRGAEVLKDAELKSRIKTKELTTEQNESPERYATDTVEQKASEAVYITGHKQMIKTGINDIPNIKELSNTITKKQNLTEFLNDLKQAQQVYVQNVRQSNSNPTIPHPNPFVKKK